MRTVLMSIKPKWVCKILNGNKTIEIRKKFPSDYVGWVYIYCTKEQGLARLNNGSWNDTFVCEKDLTENDFKQMYSGYEGKGKVVARFWVDNVDEYVYGRKWGFDNDGPTWVSYNDYEYILEKTYLTDDELRAYVDDLCFSAIHITKLEIFDKPKEIGEFTTEWKKRVGTKNEYTRHAIWKAPQSWCYISL